MRVLVTGAGGYLGRQVVCCFQAAGHEVRALLRPPERDTAYPCTGHEGVDIAWVDLQYGEGLPEALAGVELVVHLAATVLGDEDSQFNGTVVTTERLLQAMIEAGTPRLLLASSFSVYGFLACRGRLSEHTALEQDLYSRGGYAIAKVWQERAARRLCAQHDIGLTVLRPGFIWGLEHPEVPGAVLGSGRVRTVLGPRRRLPLTYVENCAYCFLLAAENAQQLDGDTYNIVDEEAVTAWDFAGDYKARKAGNWLRLPLPFVVPAMLARLADLCRRALFGRGGRLPSLLTPSNLAVFKPLEYDPCRLYRLTGHSQPHSYRQGWERTVQYPDQTKQAASAAGRGHGR